MTAAITSTPIHVRPMPVLTAMAFRTVVVEVGRGIGPV